MAHRESYGGDLPQTDRLSNLPSDYTLIQTDHELSALLDSVGFPSEYRKDITGAWVEVLDGDYGHVWFSESPAYYELGATYHNLAYYTV